MGLEEALGWQQDGALTRVLGPAFSLGFASSRSYT